MHRRISINGKNVFTVWLFSTDENELLFKKSKLFIIGYLLWCPAITLPIINKYACIGHYRSLEHWAKCLGIQLFFFLQKSRAFSQLRMLLLTSLLYFIQQFIFFQNWSVGQEKGTEKPFFNFVLSQVSSKK